MTYVLLGFLVLIVVPLLAERFRVPVEKKRAEGVPGELVKLPRGVTHIQREGPEDGAPIVLIHGLTTPTYLFAGIAPSLASAGYRVISYDLYGRGFSDCPIGRQNAAYFTEQLEAVLAHEGIDMPITLLGYSMGGAIASHWAAEHPDRVEALVLVASTGLAPANVPALSRVPIIGDWLMWVFGGVFLRRRLKAPGFQTSVVTDLCSLEVRETRTRGYLPGVLSSIRQLVTRDMSSTHHALAATNLPVFAIWAEKDQAVPIAAMARLAELNPDAWHHEVKGADHGLIHNRPGEVTASILRFFKAKSGG